MSHGDMSVTWKANHFIPFGDYSQETDLQAFICTWVATRNKESITNNLWAFMRQRKLIASNRSLFICWCLYVKGLHCLCERSLIMYRVLKQWPLIMCSRLLFLAARRHFGSSFQRLLELSLANTEHVRTSWLRFAECWLDHVGMLRRWVTSCPLQRASFEKLRWRRVQEYDIITCNCNLSIKRSKETSFSSQPLCPPRKGHRYHQCGGWVEVMEKRKMSAPVANWIPASWLYIRSLVTVVTELF